MDLETFAALLRPHREAADLTKAELDALVGLHPMDIHRLETPPDRWPQAPLMGQWRAPTRDMVIRIGVALRLTVDSVDELLIAAAYKPLWVPKPEKQKQQKQQTTNNANKEKATKKGKKS